MKKSNFIILLDVPKNQQDKFIKNYLEATANSGNLFIFSGDQKIEHLNKDFFGENISPEDLNPTHLFEIAANAPIGAFATQLGLIARYGSKFKNINYIVKLNSKTNLIPTSQRDPISLALYSVEQVVEFQKQSKLKIVGVGYTIYLGSEFESQMLAQAAQIIYQAHQNGLIAVLWIYPRGKAITDELSSQILAGAAGVANCLGADFVKINPPKAASSKESAELLLEATQAAGNTKVLCSGGKTKDELVLLQEIYDQILLGDTSGCAIGRNIHQKSLKEAIKLCKAIAAIVIDGKNLTQAKKYL